MIRGVLTGVLSDNSFAIATDETKTCLRIAQELIKHFHQPSIECERFALWLMNVLDEVITKSKKRTGMINQDKLRSKYHQLTTFEAFNGKWINFLGLLKVDKEPLFYQHVTDEMFEMRIKEIVNSSTPQPEVCSEDSGMLTFEEENAVRYVGGYVIRTLKQQKKHEDICHILEELTDNSPRSDHEDEPEAPANDWVTIIDRGGLTRITTDAYQLFYTIELCTRRYFHLNNVTSMDNTFRSHMDNCILNDDDVLFSWCMAGQDENDSLAQKCLESIVELWISIRGFAFAENTVEMYKQKEHKSTKKSRSLRSKLC